MKRFSILFFLLSTIVYSQTVEEVSEMNDTDFAAFGSKAVALFTDEGDDTLLDIYRYEHAKRNNTGIVVGDILYMKSNTGVQIPISAKLVKESEYQSGGSDWKTMDFETASRYYSITFNTKKYEVINRFVTDK